MNLKENMQAIGDELSSEEKFFESAIRTERFIKRYQKPLLISVVALVLLAVGSIGYQTYHGMKVESANKALNVLLMNPNDQQAFKTFQSDNPELFELYQLSKSIKEGDTEQLKSLQQSSIPEVADMAAYETAVLTKDTAALETYSKHQGGLFQEMSVILLAVNAIEQGNAKLAVEKLTAIKEDSSLYPIAQTLSHFGVK